MLVYDPNIIEQCNRSTSALLEDTAWERCYYLQDACSGCGLREGGERLGGGVTRARSYLKLCFDMHRYQYYPPIRPTLSCTAIPYRPGLGLLDTLSRLPYFFDRPLTLHDDLCPREIWDAIFILACTDGGRTGCALSLVSKHPIHTLVQSWKTRELPAGTEEA
jgi:hypothetical protein